MRPTMFKWRDQDVLARKAESYKKYVWICRNPEFGIKQIDLEAWGNDAKECTVIICRNTEDVYDANHRLGFRFEGTDTRILVFGISQKNVRFQSVKGF